MAASCKNAIILQNIYAIGIVRGKQPCHNRPANKREPLPKEGRAVKRPLRRADVAGAWAGLNGAQSQAETEGLGVWHYLNRVF